MAYLETKFISGAVNSIYNAVSWSENFGIIAYTCSNQIYLYDINQSLVFATFPLKAKRANCVKFIENFDFCTLVASDSQGNISIWESKEKPFFAENWKEKFFAQGNGGAISGVENITLLKLQQNSSLIISHALNGDITLFSLNDVNLDKIDTICFGNNVQETSALLKLDDNNILLILGGLDNKLHVYSFALKDVFEKKVEIFKFLLSLKGHENSITDIALIEIKKNDKNSALIASSSKDSYIRLWRIQKQDEKVQSKLNELNITNKNNYPFLIGQEKYEINLESILNLHTEPVSSIKWGRVSQNLEKISEEDLILISTSFDFSIIIWSKDEKSDIWINKSRLGQMGGNKNAFFGCCLNKNSDSLIAYTYHGNLYYWKKINENTWDSLPCISGHFSRVTDIDWNSTHEYLVSTSQDQSTRMFAKWNSGTKNWYEISRAQIHGYDINSVKNLKIQESGDKKLIDMIICGADEKIIRLFEPTAIVANMLNRISNTSLRLFFPSIEVEEQYLVKNQKNTLEYKTFTEGGAQVLGLMTKAMKPAKEKYTNYYDEEDEGGNLEENEKGGDSGNFHDFSKPPNEDYLSKHTLWPEINKLYGHGYEIQTVAASHEGNIIASSCKSQSYEHSSIFLWNPSNYSIIDKLYVHNYTVMQIEFSKNDNFMGSVSKDRQFVLFKKTTDPKKPYEKFFVNKSHARIIWCLAFSTDSNFCLTGSRDKKLKVWKIEEKSVEMAVEKTFNEGVTACAFAERKKETNYVLCVGLENGAIHILLLNFDNKTLEIVGRLQNNLGHSMAVNRLKFKNEAVEKGYELASCGDDHSVRIININFD